MKVRSLVSRRLQPNGLKLISNVLSGQLVAFCPRSTALIFRRGQHAYVIIGILARLTSIINNNARFFVKGLVPLVEVILAEQDCGNDEKYDQIRIASLSLRIHRYPLRLYFNMKVT